MMTVKEYADDIGREINEILGVCKLLKMDYITEEANVLNDDDIIELDNFFAKENDDLEEEKVVIKKKKKEVVVEEIKKPVSKIKEKLQTNLDSDQTKHIVYKENMTVKELAAALEVPPKEILKKMFLLGTVITINGRLDYETAEILALDYQKGLKKAETLDVSNFEQFELIDDEKKLEKRPPVVTIMGHVDHGKTTLLDTIRKANVVSEEAGGITQAISAYQVVYKDQKITFIDTPGHAAFTNMRARGAQITDIVIIIVAAEDGIMPQTKEAIDHAKAANVPIMVAINKIDKPDAKVDKVMSELSDYGLVPDTWGGDVLYTNISALKGTGIEELLENILLVAEMQDYKANPNRYAMGTVIEAKLDKNLGSVATLLVQSGTLRLGDPIVVGACYGKVRSLKNELNQDINQALPSQPVSITGLNQVPIAGDRFMAFEKEKEARDVFAKRKDKCRDTSCDVRTATSLDEIFAKIQEGAKEINVLIKCDVQGSAEAVKSCLEEIEIEGVHIRVIRSSVGAITESDIILAKASGAIIVGFNVRPNNDIKKCAKEHGVDIRLHNIIYKVVEEIEAAMKGMLDPVFEEKILGTAEVRQLFKFSKVGVIAGSYVTEGTIKSNALCRVIRDGVVIHDGKIKSVQREKDSTKEVKKGFECGITIDNYDDVKEKDLIEVYEMVEK